MDTLVRLMSVIGTANLEKYVSVFTEVEHLEFTICLINQEVYFWEIHPIEILHMYTKNLLHNG